MRRIYYWIFGVVGSIALLKRREIMSGLRAPVINDVATLGAWDLQFPLSPSIGPVPEAFRPIIEKTWGSKLASHQFPAQLDLAAAWEASVDTASRMGWQLKHVDRSSHTIQALDITPLMRFKDDIVIKLSSANEIVTLNMRSRSRVGKGDLGKNAARIQAYLEQLRAKDTSSASKAQ